MIDPLTPSEISIPTAWTTRHRDALLNVAIFTPITVYFLMGRRPPTWMIAASLAYTAVTFFRDLATITATEEVIAEELSAYPGHPPSPALTRFPSDPMRYRVNR